MAIGRSKPGTDPGSDASVGSIGRVGIAAPQNRSGSVLDRSVQYTHRVGFGPMFLEVGRVGSCFSNTRSISVGSHDEIGLPDI